MRQIITGIWYAILLDVYNRLTRLTCKKNQKTHVGTVRGRIHWAIEVAKSFESAKAKMKSEKMKARMR